MGANKKRRILSLILTLALLMTMYVPVHAADADPVLKMNVSYDSFEVGSTVEVTIGLAADEVSASALTGGFHFDPTVLKATKIESASGKTTVRIAVYNEEDAEWSTEKVVISNVEEANNSGTVGWEYVTDGVVRRYKNDGDYIYKVTLEVLQVKDTTIYLYEDCDLSETESITYDPKENPSERNEANTFNLYVPKKLEDANYVVVVGAPFTYTGEAFKPKVEVYLDLEGTEMLTEGKDYQIAGYENNINVGTGKVNLEGLGAYAGSAISPTFSIMKADQTLTMEDKTAVYGETGVKFEAAGAKTSVTYSGNNDNVATVAEDGSVTINGVGEVTVTAAAAEGSNYKAAEKTATLTVSAADISEAEIDPIADVEYTGSAQTPEPVVKLGDKTLVKDTDYTVEYKDYTNVGEATVTITGKGNYIGTVEASFTINRAKASAKNVRALETAYEGMRPEDLTLTGDTTPEGSTIKIPEGQAPLSAGSNTVGYIVIPPEDDPNYEESDICTVEITAEENSIVSIAVTEDPDTMTYVYGEAFDSEGMVVTATYANGDTAPVTDYTVEPEVFEEVGDVIPVTVSCGEKTAMITVTVEKAEQTIEADDFSVVFGSVTDLSKKGFKAEGELSFVLKGEAPEGTTLSDATLTAGETEGTVTITVTAAATENYNEATKDITVTVTAKTPQELSLGDDLEKTYGDEAFALTAEGAKTAVTYKSSDDSVATVDETGKVTITAVGEATITATAAEDDTYAAAEASVKLTVKPADIAGAEIAELESQIYSGKPYEPAVEATFGGKALLEDTDYTVEYKDNTNAGEATVTLTGKGNFTGTNEVSFTIEQADSIVENVKVTAPEEIFESTKMSDVVIEAEYIAPEGGELSLDAGQTLKQGSKEYKWTYIPVDTDNYRNATGTVMIDVLENTLEEVELVTGPALTVYTVGDSFDPEGMIIKATFANGDVIDEVDTSELTFEPETFTEAGEVEVTVTYKDKTVTVKVTVEEPVKYTITLSAGEGGSVKADKEEAAEGETVTITATPKSGYKFEKWTVTSGSAVVAKETSKSTTFTMPAEAVAIEATFKKGPSGGSSSGSSSDSEQFKDVPKGTYYHDPVYWAVKKGITEGTSKTTFSPMGATTRGQFVTFLWRAAGKPVVEIDCPFEDIEEDAYYYQAVLWAYKNGITDGTTPTTFRPDWTVTRGQAVTFLYRYAGEPKIGEVNPFEDVAETDYYYNAILWAVKKGITEGTSKTTFSPDRDSFRAEVVTMLYRQLAD